MFQKTPQANHSVWLIEYIEIINPIILKEIELTIKGQEIKVPGIHHIFV